MFNSEVLITSAKNMKIPSKYTRALETNQLGNIIDSNITVDGRLFVTLEENSKTLKIWTNSYTEEDIKKKMENDTGESLSGEDFLAKINNMIEKNEAQSLPFNVDFSIIHEHKQPIKHFKLMKPDIYDSFMC